MTVSPTPQPPNLRVYAKVAHTAPPGAPSPSVAAVVRFYLRGLHPKSRSLDVSSSSEAEAPPSAVAAQTLRRTFQFGELRTFLEAGRARAAVAGMLSLLPFDLDAECFQVWTGFISSVLCLAASRSRRRNLGGVIGVVHIDCFGAEVKEEGSGKRAGVLGGAEQAEASFGRAEITKCGGGAGAGADTKEVFEGCSCPICCEAFRGRMEVARTPCGHSFHGACIARWLQSHRTCPVCRFEMHKKVKDFEKRG